MEQAGDRLEREHGPDEQRTGHQLDGEDRGDGHGDRGPSSGDHHEADGPQ
jgi:hypothetical protein